MNRNEIARKLATIDNDYYVDETSKVFISDKGYHHVVVGIDQDTDDQVEIYVPNADINTIFDYNSDMQENLLNVLTNS